MNTKLKSILLIYCSPRAIVLLLMGTLISGIIAFAICQRISHRYAVTALIKVAEVGVNLNASQATSGLPYASLLGKPQSSIRSEAIAYIEFQYLSRSRDANGVRLIEVKELKSSEKIELAAEGPSMEAIDKFIKDILLDLQTKYRPSVDSALSQGIQEVRFLRDEIDSLEALIAKVQNGLNHVGPAPTLVSQAMEINQSLVRLKQEYFLKRSMISNEKIHNFKMDILLPVAEGAPVYPKTKQAVSFLMVIAFLVTAYGLFLIDFFRKKMQKSPGAEIHDFQVSRIKETSRSSVV